MRLLKSNVYVRVLHLVIVLSIHVIGHTSNINNVHYFIFCGRKICYSHKQKYYPALKLSGIDNNIFYSKDVRNPMEIYGRS